MFGYLSINLYIFNDEWIFSIQFKEEQARRKLFSLESEADSARALTHEAERAMRAELSALREQITQVSKELLKEDELNVKIKDEVRYHYKIKYYILTRSCDLLRDNAVLFRRMLGANLLQVLATGADVKYSSSLKT